MILERHEVCDIHSYDMLAPKMHPKFVAAKLFPKSLLCDSHLLTILDGVVFNISICQRICSSSTSNPFKALARGSVFGHLLGDGRALRNEVL